jgi:D-alanyl-D-alanine carboxypeptidase/D-alanyl-D-alanine-endopeptidase (penicillin-binding protein 4)
MPIKAFSSLFLVAFAALVLILGGAPAKADEAPPAVSEHLRTAGIPPGNAGISVQEVSSSRPLLSVNQATPLNPASTMKLVTTYAGLELLGPAYRWRTEIYLGGPLRDGVVDGPLYMKGYGDPKLTLEAFWLLLRDLRASGVREIRGDLILDRSHFATVTFDASLFDGDGSRPYNVGPDALLVNFKAIRFRFSPDLERSAVRVSAEPRLVEVNSTLRLAEGTCGDWREKLKADFQPRSGTVTALFAGSYNASCGDRDWHVALLPPTTYTGGVFRLLWAELGGSITGAARDGTAPTQGKPFMSLESPTLSEVVRDINKFSNNVMARQLYLTIAAEQAGIPATTDNAQRAIKAWLASKGLEIPELVIENGAGLSRVDRISAQSLTTLLVSAFRSPSMPELAASLPLVAVDGTMRRRLKGGGIAGQAHIKTGSLSDVRAIAGYVLDRSGRRYAVTMIVNHPNAQRSQAAQDALLNWVHNR